MPKPKVNGTLQPVEQPREILWDPRSGAQLVRTFECADPNGLYGIAAGFAGSLWGYRHSTGGPKSVLVASASGPDAGRDRRIRAPYDWFGRRPARDRVGRPFEAR